MLVTNIPFRKPSTIENAPRADMFDNSNNYK